MDHFTNATLPCLALLLAVAVTSAGSETEQSLEVIRSKHNLPALAVVVVKEGKICDRAAVGLRKLGDPAAITIDDQFHIGSCTKSMTATLTAMLIEEGKLRWETTIGEVFPELRLAMETQYRTVTVEQLLRHRGGCPGNAPPEAWKEAWAKHGTPTQQRYQFIQAVLNLPPEAAPGSRFIYSNQGYAIVGAMLEKITGQPWETLMRERLFKPLKMDSAGFGPPGTLGKIDQPRGHSRVDGKTKPEYNDNPPAIGPAGTVHCSLEDLARYTMLHLNRGRDGGLLKPESFRKLHTPPDGADYACGWISCPRSWAGGKALTHNGSNTMWFAIMWLAPEKNFSVVVATNIAGPEAEKGCDEAAAAMIGKWLKR